MVESYLESNAKKKAKAEELKEKEEIQKTLLDHKEKFEKFRKLCDSEEWKECRDFIKDEIYQGLSYAPGDGGDWWLHYSWGLKTFIERVESHARKYDEAIEQLSK